MADRYVFADEAGNFDFSRGNGASRYFILATIALDDCNVGADLLELRRQLAWNGVHLDKTFHATTDPQAVRDEVFKVIAGAALRVDATILEKPKAQPHLQSERALYKMAWYLHFKYVAPRIANKTDRMLVAAASIGTKRKRKAFHVAIDDVVAQTAPCASYRVAFWPMESDPCLQIADYCTWAVQRKWEQNDTRSHVLVKTKIRSEFDVWRIGSTLHY